MKKGVRKKIDIAKELEIPPSTLSFNLLNFVNLLNLTCFDEEKEFASNPIINPAQAIYHIKELIKFVRIQQDVPEEILQDMNNIRIFSILKTLQLTKQVINFRVKIGSHQGRDCL